MAMSLPSFVAQRPEAVQSFVTVEQTPKPTSIWGQVVPNLVNAATGLKGLLAEDPNKGIGEQNSANAFENYMANQDNDNPVARQQKKDQEVARLRAAGKTEAADALAKRDVTQMGSRQTFQNQRLGDFNTAKSVANSKGLAGSGIVSGQRHGSELTDGNALAPPDLSHPGTPTSQPSGTVPQATPPAANPQSPDYKTRLTPGPRNSNQVADAPQFVGNSGRVSDSIPSGDDSAGGSGVAPQALPSDQPHATTPEGYSVPGREDTAHPLLRQVSAQLKATKGWDVPPSQLAATPGNGVIASLQAVKDGKMPYVHEAHFPPPVPGSADPSLLQAAQAAGTTAGPQLRDLVSSASSVRAITAILSGREPDSADLFGMSVDNKQAKQILDSANFASGADQPKLDLADLHRIAALQVATPERRQELLKGDDGPAYQAAQEKYASASHQEQVQVLAASALMGQGQNASKGLELQTEQLKQHAADTKNAQSLQRLEFEETKRRNQATEGIQGQQVGIQREHLTLAQQQQNFYQKLHQLDADPVWQAKLKEASIHKGMLTQMDHHNLNNDKFIEAYAVANGLNKSVDDSEMKSLTQQASIAQAQYKEAQENQTRMSETLRRAADANYARDPITGEDLNGMDAARKTRMRTDLQARLTAADTEVGSKQKAYQDLQKQIMEKNGLYSNGKPLPKALLFETANAPGNQDPKTGRPLLPKPEVLAAVKTLWAHPDQSLSVYQSLKPLEGSMTPAEKALLKRAIREYVGAPQPPVNSAKGLVK